MANLKLEYLGICNIWYDNLPRSALYVGYNSDEEAHIMLVRNPQDKKDIIPLKTKSLRSNSSISHLDMALTPSENTFANKLLERAGI